MESRSDEIRASVKRDAVLRILAGEESVEGGAQRLGISPVEVASWRDLYVQGLRDGQPGTKRRWGYPKLALALMLVAICVLPVAGLASDMVGGLYIFKPRDPAKADEINANFAQLKAWIEGKVGSVEDSASSCSTVKTSSITATGAAAAGSLSVSGTASIGSGATINGDVTIGSDTIPGGDALTVSPSTLTVHGKVVVPDNANKPIRRVTFQGLGDFPNRDTRYSTDRWIAFIGGFEANGDIKENGTGEPLFRMRMDKEITTGTWFIRGEIFTNAGEAWPNVEVIFVSKDIATDSFGAPDPNDPLLR
jgi:hypothetical protein